MSELEKMKAVHRRRRYWSQLVDESIQARQQYGRGQGNQWIDTPVNRADYRGVDNRKDFLDIRPSARTAPLPAEDKRTYVTVNGVKYGTTKQMAPVLTKELKRYFPDVNARDTYKNQGVYVRFEKQQPGVLGYHQWKIRGGANDTTIVSIQPGEGPATQRETLTHELIHLFRHKQKRKWLTRHESARKPEETETVGETTVRLGASHLNSRHSSNYYGVMNVNPYPGVRIHDRKVLAGDNSKYNTQRSLKSIPKNFKRMDNKVDQTNLFKGWDKTGNTSGLFTTSEGEVYNFSLKGKINPHRMAHWIDRQDGITGEENVFVYNQKKKRLILSKLPRSKWRRA